MSHPTLPTEFPKLIYFAERREYMDAQMFRKRWREHARLGMSQPRWRNVQRYVHCDAIEGKETLLPAANCDGVAIVWYRDENRRLQHLADNRVAPLMKQDESQTFARPVRDVALLADEFNFTPAAAANTTQKLFVQIWRQSDSDRTAFRNWWLKEVGPVLEQGLRKAGICRGYWQNHARIDQSVSGAFALCDCVDEIACDDRKQAEVLLLRSFDEINRFTEWVCGYKAVWTLETVLHDAR